MIDRDDVYGVLAEDGTFSPVYRVPEEASPPGTPRWTSDLGEHVWDSCVAFVRHAERPAHFLRDSDGIGVTDLTDRGREDARILGTLLRGYDVSLSSSPVSRCVSTCVSVAEGLGRDLPVERREEVGGYGTSLYLDGYAGHVYREPGTTAVLGNLSGRPIEGWHPLEECVRRMMDVILPFLSREGVLTLCVSHDRVVAPRVGGSRGGVPPGLGGWLAPPPLGAAPLRAPPSAPAFPKGAAPHILGRPIKSRAGAEDHSGPAIRFSFMPAAPSFHPAG